MKQVVTNSYPETEEFVMIRDYAILPFILTMVQNAIDQLNYERNILNEAHKVVAEEIARSVMRDIHSVRQELTKRKIKVTTADRDEFVLSYFYTCRGYEGVFGITREESRAQISIRLGRYVSELIKRMKEVPTVQSKAPLK